MPGLRSLRAALLLALQRRGLFLSGWRFGLGCLLLAGGYFATRRLGDGLQLSARLVWKTFHSREAAGLLGAGPEFINRKFGERPAVIQQGQNFFRNLWRSFFNCSRWLLLGWYFVLRECGGRKQGQSHKAGGQG